MNPLNWFTLIAQFALGSGLLGNHEIWIKIVMVFLVIGVLVFYGYVYRHFMLTNPDRLQSENYNLSVLEHTALLQGEVFEAPVVEFRNLPSTEYRKGPDKPPINS